MHVSEEDEDEIDDDNYENSSCWSQFGNFDGSITSQSTFTGSRPENHPATSDVAHVNCGASGLSSFGRPEGRQSTGYPTRSSLRPKSNPPPALPKPKNATLVQQTPGLIADQLFTDRHLNDNVGPAAHGGHASGLKDYINKEDVIRQLRENNQRQQTTLISGNAEVKDVTTTPSSLHSKLQSRNAKQKSVVDCQSTALGCIDTSDRTGQLRMRGKAKGPLGRVDSDEYVLIDQSESTTNSGNNHTHTSRRTAATGFEPERSHACVCQPSSRVTTAASTLSSTEFHLRKPPAPLPTEKMFHSTSALPTPPSALQPEKPRSRTGVTAVPYGSTDVCTHPIQNPPPPLSKPPPLPEQVETVDKNQPATQEKILHTLKGMEKNLHHFSWYSGAITRREAEKRIKRVGKDGAFVIRKVDDPLCPDHLYSLSLLLEKKPHHIIIRRRSKDNKFALGTEKLEEPVFDSLIEMVVFYTTNDVELVLRKFGNGHLKASAKLVVFKV